MLDVPVSAVYGRAVSPGVRVTEQGQFGVPAFLDWRRQRPGSAAIHSSAGKLQDGRTAKTLVSGPATAAAASASLRVWTGSTMNRVPSGTSNTDPAIRG